MYEREDLKSYAKFARHKAGLVSGQIEVTSECYQHCQMCDSWRDDLTGLQQGIMTHRQMISLTQQLSEIPTFEHLALTGGDPQAWPPFFQYLSWFASSRTYIKFKLQINTALTQPIEAPDLWLDAVDSVRVSLDAIDDDVYQKIRGDKNTKVSDVLRRIKQLMEWRIEVSVLCCVQDSNLDQITKMLDTFKNYKIRKLIFLPVIGDRGNRVNHFWERYDKISKFRESYPWEVSFAENPLQIREFLKEDQAKDIPCYSGNISFHIKSNGDWYPCCLVGGEALETHKNMVVGNVFMQSILDVWERYVAEKHYGCSDKPCTEICQYKQFNVNYLAHRSDLYQLRMP